MKSLQSLKDLAKKKKEQRSELLQGKAFAKKADIDDLKRKRDGESAQPEEVLKRLKVLPRDEVFRRLRALGQPVTLFGEDDGSRFQRLKQCELEFRVEDDALGGQQGNALQELKRREAQERAAGARLSGSGGSTPGDKAGGAVVVASTATQRAFELAAQKLDDAMEDPKLSIEDRLAKYFKRWFKAWREDLDHRPEEAKSSREGHKADEQYNLQWSYFKPLFHHLEHRNLNEEIKVGLWEIVQAARNRNYQHANQLYLNLSIGTAPWPIGVTSVGIHERSAREKISFSWNGQAHIMNDEATRKYLQALQQLLRHVQRLYPTDPSRSMDFSTTGHQGVGAFGGGSEKQALLEAERNGETWRTLGLQAAPHYLDKKGGTIVPKKWEHILKSSEAAKETAH